jgi:hypothetical protein
MLMDKTDRVTDRGIQKQFYWALRDIDTLKERKK